MTDITWKDVYDGPEELADCLSRGAAECERRGQYELSSHATVAAHVLYELSEENARLREVLARCDDLRGEWQTKRESLAGYFESSKAPRDIKNGLKELTSAFIDQLDEALGAAK